MTSFEEYIIDYIKEKIKEKYKSVGKIKKRKKGGDVAQFKDYMFIR